MRLDKIALSTLAFLLLAAHAHAAPCTVPSFYDGYSAQFFPTPTTTPVTTGFIYGLDETTLYVTFSNLSITGFSNVPLATAQVFAYTQTPDSFYKANILPIYTETYVCGAPPLG